MKKIVLLLFIINFSLSIAFAQNQAIVANHNSCNINEIPEQYINLARETFNIAYGSTSHGGQLIAGLELIVSSLNGKDDDGIYVNTVIINQDTCNCVDLFPSYPNPADDLTYFHFKLKYTSKISLIIYDLHGNKVLTLIDNLEYPGEEYGKEYKELFSLKSLPVGIYEYQLITTNVVKSSKLVIVR